MSKQERLDDEMSLKVWQENADSWTELSRMGYDICRDEINTPAFLSILPNVKKKKGLDIGCGEGTNTRVVASLGASLTGIDPSSKFIEHASSHPENDSLSIDFQVGFANDLNFSDESFDFCMSTMCLMDVCDLEGALKETYRVLKPGGFFQFSIVHPCFSPPQTRWIEDGDAGVSGVMVSGYFRQGGNIEEWSFTTVPDELKSKHKDFKVVHYHRTISNWLNMLIKTGFVVDELLEPQVSDASVAKYPNLVRMKEISWFLHIRVKKP